MSYRVKRKLPDNEYVQLKNADKEDCKQLLRSLKDKWNEVKDVGVAFGDDPFVVNLKRDTLTVTKGDRVVDQYIIEKS